MSDEPEWQVSRVFHVHGEGWRWEIAHRGRLVLTSAEAKRNPASCAREAEDYRRHLAAGRLRLGDDGTPCWV